MPSHETTELRLYADNNQQIYGQRLAIRTNLIKKMCKGNFDADLAAKGFKYLTDNAAKKYTKDHGSPGDRIFSVADRMAVARDYVKDLLADVKSGTDLTKAEEALLAKSTCKRKGAR